MKNTIISFLFLFAAAFAHAQSKTKTQQKFTTLPNGVKFLSIQEAKSDKRVLAAEGDQLKVYFEWYRRRNDKDSLIMSSNKAPEKFITVGLSTPKYKGDLMEGLARLAEGDSAQFILPADSFMYKTAGAQVLPDFIRSGDEILFCVRLLDLISKAEFEEIQRVEMQKQMEEMSAKSAAEKANRDEYLTKNSIAQQPTSSGLIVVMQQEGSGPKPQAGQKVTVHYTGYLTNGNKFDSSVDRGQPFSFTLGKGQVIKGWDEGIAMLSPGAKAKLIIPSSIGYGGRGMGSIPAFSTLIFDVELISFE
jgi:FKBP-type peptidyl-prolyl cis-trans isomerase FkpA